MIELDGATGEGGGQILRSSLALSLCTGQPVTLRRIRARRPKPGLMRQHLACVNAAVAISGANAEGAELGSQELVFEPGTVRPGDYRFSVGTAGSCSLVLQTILPPLMMAGSASRVVLAGGTHNPMAPPFHFLGRCFAPLLGRLGVGLALALRRMGFYPAGGGEFSALITPAVRQNEGPGNALMATLVHEHVTESVTAFGEKGLSSEVVASSLAREVQAYQRSAGALGPHLVDQWMLPLALAVVGTQRPASFTCTDVTDHATTNIGVIERFLPVRFEVETAGTGALIRVLAMSDG